jgi:hypothetical protein
MNNSERNSTEDCWIASLPPMVGEKRKDPSFNEKTIYGQIYYLLVFSLKVSREHLSFVR